MNILWMFKWRKYMENREKNLIENSFTNLVSNNALALALHIVIIIFSSIFLIIFVGTGPMIGIYTTNIISRLIFIIILLSLYFFSGTLLIISKERKFDFYAGILIGLIGIIIWVYTFQQTGMNLFETPVELRDYWIVYNLYYAPFTVIYFLAGLNSSPLLSLATNLLPSFALGCGIRYKRKKQR